MTQLSLPFDKSREQRWREFHLANPHVYTWIRDQALKLKARGRHRYSARTLIEIYRWHVDAGTFDEHEDFKINDHYSAFYSRLLMRDVPELAGFFETRGDD